MADRFALHSSKDEMENVFGVHSPREDYFQSNYNISPGLLTPAIFLEDGKRRILNFQWGLIPEDADSDDEGKEHFEFPAEALEENDWLKKCFKQRRCLIPAHGFYKWKSSKKKATPFYIRLLSSRVMAIAGVYSVWESDSGRDVLSFAMLTTEANVLVQPVDDRMPVILRPEAYGTWLGEEDTDEESLRQLLEPYDLTDMAVNRVSEKVNDINSSGPELIQPIPK